MSISLFRNPIQVTQILLTIFMLFLKRTLLKLTMTRVFLFLSLIAAYTVPQYIENPHSHVMILISSSN